MFFAHKIQNNPLYIGSLDNPSDRERALRQILQGEPLVMKLGGVYGLFANAHNQKAIARIFEIKGENKRSLTIIKHTDDIIHLADQTVIPPELGNRLTEIGKMLGLVAHLRFPILPKYVAALPEFTYSYHTDTTTGNTYPLIQYLDPSGHLYMSEFINELQNNGVQYIAVTSFNNHAIGEPEITQKERAIQLSKEKNLPLILEDPLHVRQDITGSYAIVMCLKNALELVRPGAVDAKIINAILNGKLLIDGQKQPKQPSHDYSQLVSLLSQAGLTGKRAKNAFLLYMLGIDPQYMLTQLI